MEPKPGKDKAAREYVKRFADYEKKNFGVNWEVLGRLTSARGEHARLYILIRFESLAAWGDHWENATADDGWQKLVDEGFRNEDAIFAHNSFSRSVFRVL
jgi:hypothetical protein